MLSHRIPPQADAARAEPAEAPPGAGDAAGPMSMILVEEKPSLLALYKRGPADSPGSVVSWVLVLPDGSAIVLPADGRAGPSIRTTLADVRRRWVRAFRAELVEVAGREVVRRAA